MSVRHIRFMLRLAAMLLLAASVAVGVWAATAPVQLLDHPTDTPQAPARAQARTEPSQSDPNEYEAVFERRFRRLLYDPPPKEPEPVVEAPPTPPPVRLVATMPEPGGGHVMLADTSGAVLVRALGQTVTAAGSSVVIKEISSDKVVLLHEERLVTLTLGKN